MSGFETPPWGTPGIGKAVNIKRVLLTGAGGFVGAHTLRHLLMNTDWQIVCPVTFRHRGNGDRIASSIENRDEWQSRVETVMCDLSAPIAVTTINRFGAIDAILNIASESHVDRSISDPVSFTRNNVDLMLNLLEYARVIKPKVFLHMSTDEVFGPADSGESHKEWDPTVPSNPYSASKAAQESICISYWRTYDVPLIMTNCYDMNTRVLTDHGFKGHGELREGDRVWTLDGNEQMVLESVQRIVKMPGDGKMVRFKGGNLSQLVTRNHRMMIRRPAGKPRRWGPIEETHAENLLNMKGRVRIPRTGHWVGDSDPTFRPYEHLAPTQGRSKKRLPDSLPTEQVAALFGWYISEGCTSGTTTRFGAGRPLQQETIASLLAEIEGEPYINERAVCIANSHLAQLFDLCGQGARNKRIPEFIRNLDEKYLRIFFEAMIEGDGSWYLKGAVYYTTSPELASQMCEVGMKLGYAARISTRKTWNPTKTVVSESYIVRLSTSVGDIEAKHVSEEDYEGDVWCLSVPSGRVFVERDGCISLSGQTMNMFGEMQDPEKYFVKAMRQIMRNEPVTVHVGPSGEAGSRHYLHARNFSDAWLYIMDTVEPVAYGETDRPVRFNISGDREVNNVEFARMIGAAMGVEPRIEKVSPLSLRPGHDLRYALDGSKIAALGWKAPISFEQSLNKAVRWTLEHPEWLES